MKKIINKNSKIYIEFNNTKNCTNFINLLYKATLYYGSFYISVKQTILMSNNQNGSNYY